MIWRYSRKVIQISPKSDTLVFFSKTALTIFLAFGMKLVLNMTFNLNETSFSEKNWNLEIFDLERRQKVFGHFLDFASLVFLDFAHNDKWAWCLVVFLQFTGLVNVFLFFSENFWNKKILLKDFSSMYSDGSSHRRCS